MRWFVWHLALLSLLALTTTGAEEPVDPSAIGETPPAPPAPPEPPPAGIDAAPAAPPDESDPFTLSGRAVVAKYFVSLLARGHFATAAESYSDEGAAPAADELAATWHEWEGRLGRFEDAVATHPAHLHGHEAVRVTGQFEEGRADIEVVFDAGGHITGFYLLPSDHQTLSESLYEPPGYVRQAAFVEHAVEIGQVPWVLPGTVSLPAGDGPYPAVVLVAGSGPQNADEATGPVKPFRDLAWGLASGAIAVLRYDNRRYVYGAQLETQPGYTAADEVVADAVAAIARLRATPKVARDRIFVLGHGLAGGLLPRIVDAAGALAGGILLAGWTRPLEDVMVDQAAYLAGLPGADAPGAPDVAALRADAAQIKDAAALAAVPAGAALLGLPAAYWRDLRDYRPAAAAARLALPLLVLQGERDYQVTMTDFAGWQAALAGRPNVEFKTYPALGHPFLPGEGPPSPDDYELVNHVPDEVIEDLGNWIRRR